MMSRLYQTNILSWIDILLVHCNNSPRENHDSIILILSQPVFDLYLGCLLNIEATNIKLNNDENHFNSDIK